MQNIARAIYAYYKNHMDYESFLTHYEQYAYTPISYASILNPGVKKTLTELKKRNMKTALASSSDLADINAVLTQCELHPYFDSVLSGEMLQKTKPHPEIYIRTAQNLHSSDLADINAVLTQCELHPYFDSVLSGEMLQKTKPHPEIYIRTAQNLHTDCAECLVLEDSPYGIEAAKKAGMYVLAKKDTRFGFQQNQADAIITDVEEVLTYLD